MWGFLMETQIMWVLSHAEILDPNSSSLLAQQETHAGNLCLTAKLMPSEVGLCCSGAWVAITCSGISALFIVV